MKTQSEILEMVDAIGSSSQLRVVKNVLKQIVLAMGPAIVPADPVEEITAAGEGANVGLPMVQEMSPPVEPAAEPTAPPEPAAVV